MKRCVTVFAIGIVAAGMSLKARTLPYPGEYDMAWSPSPPEGSRYSPEEMAKIRFNANGKTEDQVTERV